MLREEARIYIRAQIENYLRSRGAEPSKPFCCFNPAHSDAHPSMSYDKRRQKVHCFSCGADYDIFDLIGIEFGLNSMSDVFKKAYELYNVNIDGENHATARISRIHTITGASASVGSAKNAVAPRSVSINAASSEAERVTCAAGGADIVSNVQNQPVSGWYDPISSGAVSIQSEVKNTVVHPSYTDKAHSTEPRQIDYSAYLAAAQSRIEQTDYPALRGLSSKTARRFGLGFDPDFRTRAGDEFVTWQAMIIPNDGGGYVARNTDISADKSQRIRKRGDGGLFNTDALYESSQPVFVVEGEIDAMSIEEVGGRAVALGSTANVNRLAALVKRIPSPPTLLIALDADAAGVRAAQELAAALSDSNARLQSVDINCGCKDANDALRADRAAFSNAVRESVAMAADAQERARLKEIEEYRSSCAASYIKSFLSGIVESVDTPSISTGFKKLDNALDGGLYEGLYIIGAITSLGKTTFVLQMADQIAAQGQDVMIFSLEMARSELMAKSISRLTSDLCREECGTERYSKTARGVTTGKRYKSYNVTEKDYITRAVNRYSEFAGNIFIYEGVGNIGVESIRDTVAKHTRMTGVKPVVIIDYLQILSPYSERMTDKQNTDKAVLELKRVSRDFKLPVIGISSFNRQNYREAVTMEAFKESGAIEYSSDVLIGLQLAGAGNRDFDPSEAKKKDPRQIELVILKNRNGSVGAHIEYDYYPMFNRFDEKKGFEAKLLTI